MLFPCGTSLLFPCTEPVLHSNECDFFRSIHPEEVRPHGRSVLPDMDYRWQDQSVPLVPEAVETATDSIHHRFLFLSTFKKVTTNFLQNQAHV